MQAKESKGNKFPLMYDIAWNSLCPRLAGPEGRAVCPEYLTGLNIAICPSDRGGSLVSFPDFKSISINNKILTKDDYNAHAISSKPS